MTWDDNWTRALVTVLAATVGAILAGAVNAYAAKQKVREVELQYMYKLRDGYLDNARKLAGEVYIPISIALTSLFNSYERFATTISATEPTGQKPFRSDFEIDCLRYLQTIDDLLARGADAYLTTSLDEQLNQFSNFIRNSLDQKIIRKRSILQTKFGMFGFSASPTISLDVSGSEGFARVAIPTISLRPFTGIGLSYSEVVLAAPFESREFEKRIRTEIPRIKFLVKEVTLGSNPPT
ncbi:MAG: hypothetical protein U1E45_02270 [Geminicoccaceae bacterium]